MSFPHSNGDGGGAQRVGWEAGFKGYSRRERPEREREWGKVGEGAW